MHLGTNNPPTDSDRNRILDDLAAAVVLVTTRPGPAGRHEHPDRQAAIGRPNVVVVDWYAISASHPEWFVHDGTDPGRRGPMPSTRLGIR